MASDGKKYVVYGMKAECSQGTMQNYLTTDTGHGIIYQGNPLLNANDHEPQVNLTHFGDCKSRVIYEEAKRQADEKYKADADDGFFAKAGKLIAKTAAKAVVDIQSLGCHKCELDTPLPWIFCNDEHMIDGAPALTMESQCACRYGGIIRIVQEDESTGNDKVTKESEDIVLEDEMTQKAADARGILVASTNSVEIGDNVGKKQDKGLYAGVIKALYDTMARAKAETDKQEEKMTVGYTDSTKQLIMELEGSPFYEARINNDGTYTIGYGYDFDEKINPDMYYKYLQETATGIKAKGKMTEQEAQETILLAAKEKDILSNLEQFINGEGAGNTVKKLQINQNQYDALFSYFYSNGPSVFEISKYDEWVSYGGEYEERAMARKELCEYIINNNGNYDAEKVKVLFIASKGANINYNYEARREREAEVFCK